MCLSLKFIGKWLVSVCLPSSIINVHTEPEKSGRKETRLAFKWFLKVYETKEYTVPLGTIHTDICDWDRIAQDGLSCV
jgi:hypothetical protein